MIGLIVAIFAFIVLIGRIDDAIDEGQAIFEAAATASSPSSRSPSPRSS